MTVIARILEQAAHRPDAMAVSVPGGRSWTYRALADEIDAWAGALARRGVRPGDRVSAVMAQSSDALLLHLGLMRVGAVLHPIGPGATPREVDDLVAEIEPVLVLGDGAVTVGGARFDGPLPSEDDLACILSTSGTTGRPKGSLTTHRNLRANADALIEAWGITSADTILHLLPLHHVHGLFVALHPFLMTGGSVVLAGRFSADTVVDRIGDATVLMGVPTFYTRLLDDDRVDADLVGRMRLFTSGSAPLLAATHREWEERTGHRILERYGMTEIQMALSNPLDGERRAGTVGRPLPGLDARVGAGQVLEVRGPTVSPGYWRQPEASADARTADGWFITGDVVEQSDDGYFTIVGRTSDMIISGGLNVYPKEVEDVLDTLPGVGESAVIGLPHPDFGEAVAAVCVGDGDETLLVDACRDALSAHKVPKAIEWVHELPRNSMGKVQKAVLRERFADRFDS